MRCPDCNKFVSLELVDEPEISDEQVADDGTVTCSARVVRTCAECSQELKEATFELEGKVDLSEHAGEGHELEVAVDASATEASDNPGRPARYQRTLFGVEATFTITCSCGATVGTCAASDSVTASGMEELA